MCSGRPRGRGFSLIEVLVAIAIISLLMTILLPSLSGVRRTAKMTLCLTNLHSVGQALSTYADDHAEVYPGWSNYQLFGGDGTGDDFPGPGWTEQLLDRQYVDAPRAFTDPARPREHAPFSYFLQTRFMWRLTGRPGEPLAARLVHLPGAFVLGGDCNNPRLYPRPYGFDARQPDCDLDDASRPLVFFDDPPPAPILPSNEAELNPHGAGRANILFLDGHAATFTTFEPAMMTWHGTRMANWLLN